MTELSRSLLAAARDGLAPDAAVAARVRAKVAASIAAGAAVTAVATHSASSAAVPASASSSSVASTTAPTVTTSAVTSNGSAGPASLIFKLGAALLVVGAITTSVLGTRDRGSDAPHLSMTANADLDEPRAAERTVSHDDSANAGAAAQDDSARTNIASAIPHRSVAIDSSAIEIDVARTAEPVSLSREVELIDLAMTSLRKHAPAAALAAIHTFERETFGHGQMAEEAAAIAIEARCGLHQDVTEPLAAFDRAWPSSAQRSRVVTTCFTK